jgi:hypothetical protein
MRDHCVVLAGDDFFPFNIISVYAVQDMDFVSPLSQFFCEVPNVDGVAADVVRRIKTGRKKKLERLRK